MTKTIVAITSKEQGLKLLMSGEVTVEQYMAYDAANSKGPAGVLQCKVSEKGGVSIYGLNSKWPVTLYQEQWERLLDYGPKVLEFIKANKAKLQTKEGSQALKAKIKADADAAAAKADGETDAEFAARRAK